MTRKEYYDKAQETMNDVRDETVKASGLILKELNKRGDAELADLFREYFTKQILLADLAFSLVKEVED